MRPKLSTNTGTIRRVWNPTWVPLVFPWMQIRPLKLIRPGNFIIQTWNEPLFNIKIYTDNNFQYKVTLASSVESFGQLGIWKFYFNNWYMSERFDCNIHLKKSSILEVSDFKSDTSRIRYKISMLFESFNMTHVIVRAL